MAKPVIVHRARSLLPDGRWVVADDWPTPELALRASGLALFYMAPAGPGGVFDIEQIENRVALELAVDLARPFGCSLMIEED